jgi:hypothetical protein
VLFDGIYFKFFASFFGCCYLVAQSGGCKASCHEIREVGEFLPGGLLGFGAC